MLAKSQRFSFDELGASGGQSGTLPYLPLKLAYQGNLLSAHGLLDTGATVNVLPYSLGEQLGAEWESQATALRLTGNLAQYEARALVLEAQVGAFAPVKLAFAWTRALNVPLILGQVNFFLEFDVCFSASKKTFELRRRDFQGEFSSQENPRFS